MKTFHADDVKITRSREGTHVEVRAPLECDGTTVGDTIMGATPGEWLAICRRIGALCGFDVVPRGSDEQSE